MRWKIWSIGTAIIICLSLLMSLPKFSQVPAGLNRDEAALGYNAYSLLKTGKDEWGKPWPISITSFGDQKLPGYIYTLIPFIAVFGLETWVVRLPSLLAGLVIIAGMGLIAIKLAKLAKHSVNWQLIASFTVMTLVAISPWHMHFSRVAYETHLAMAFFVSSLASLLFALDTKHKLLQRTLLIVAGLLAGLTLLTYHGYQIFTPLFLLAFLAIFFQQVKKLDKTGLIIGTLLGLLSIVLLITGGVLQANQTKSQGINPFNTQVLLKRATEYRSVSNLPPLINKVLFNKFNEGLIAFTQNYASTFSGTFFFIHGSNHGDHNPGNGSNINLFLAPFILLGLLTLGKHHKEKAAQIIIAWLFLALIPSSLTINPLLEVRMGAVFPILELLAVLGVFALFTYLSKPQQKIAGIILLFIALLSASRLFIFYTILAPVVSNDNTHYHLLAKTLSKHQINSEIVLTQSPTSSPYIWYLFENKIDPTFAQKSIVQHPTTDEGFKHVKQIDNVYFETINWDNLENKPYTLILKPIEISMEQRMSPQFSLIEVVTDTKNQTVYEVWKYN